MSDTLIAMATEFTAEDVEYPFFPPASGRGKHHAKSAITEQAYCGKPTFLSDDSAVYASVRELRSGRPHPVICRECARLVGEETPGTGTIVR